MIKTTIQHLRDPFLLYDNGVYYVYGTGAEEGWQEGSYYCCYKNTSGKLDGTWEKVEHRIFVNPPHAVGNRWAPEVHKYKGSFYMFTTYFSDETNHRGCTILKSEHPEGPFVEITGGHITPQDWDAIDGTFFVDEAGQPWMMFVHEWVCMPDQVGTMAVAKLSEDLTHFISEPVELFRADSPSWAVGGVTDGCFLHRLKDGQLMMIWSNFDKDGYCVGIAHAKDNRIDGEWVQQEKQLYTKSMGEYDGGHGMIFTDVDEKMYLCIHSPNTPNEKTAENTVFIPIREENGTLICE